MLVETAKMKEFRLVFYMNGTAAINFWGGRAAASPLAYYFHINQPKKRRVFLSGSFIFQGLGKYGELIKDELEKDSEPISLPKHLTIKGERICISNKAYIYQNNDPLFTQAEHEVYWEATIDKIGKRFKQKERSKYKLAAVQMGLQTYKGKKTDENHDEWRALVSDLVRFEHPVDKDNCPWKVYGGNWEPRSFWRDGIPSIPHKNAFVHLTTCEWNKFDKSIKINTLNITQVTDALIKHNRIHESLVHEMLKMMFAREEWWVNFEVPIRGGRIDFLVKKSSAHRHPWTVIEVKLEDNPDAVDQLDTYKEHIESDVRQHKRNSYFWPLWNGKECTKPKGVVLCAFPGTETVNEAKAHKFDVWTYEYIFKDKTFRIEIKDAKSKKRMLKSIRIGT